MTAQMKNYKVLAAAKKAQQQQNIPKDWYIPVHSYQDAANVMDVPLSCGLLNQTEAKITSDYDATALLERLKSREWSVEQVTIAFCKRAAIAHQLTNCLTEIFFSDAIERAKKLDLEYGKFPSANLPPLFGLPISLKDSFQVSGYDTSTGMGCYVDEPAEKNSALAAMLLDLGAVLYCKTNLPQTIMTGDSDNNIFGRTMNPRNKSLTAGGSTGGEGALLALRGSILGFGTDIGGSIRVPALCNGIYGFKPSVGMVPHGGVRDVNVPGTVGILSSAGPMATSLRDCALLLKTILRADPWKYNSTTVSIPWTDLPQSDHKLRIGVAHHDGVFTPTPPVRRALNQAIDALRGNDNIEIIPITLPDVEAHYQDIIQYYVLSGSDYYYEQFARTGEPPIPSVKNIGLLSVPGTDLKGFFDLNVRRAEAAKKYLELFREIEIDVILMPPSPHTAVPLDQYTKAAYTSLWNYLDYPAIVIPTDHVRDTDAADDLSNAQFGLEDEKLYRMYTGPEQYKDAPLGVMVVGYRHNDEALLLAANVVDSVLHNK